MTQEHLPDPAYDYDAFISYSHDADERDRAPALQRLIRRVGRPWFRRGLLRVFRDRTNLPMSEDLWESIESSLARSRYFILMASPAAARSSWVSREVEYWRRHRERSTFLVVRTAGVIEWAGGDFDWTRTDALPKVMSGWFTNVPTWSDAEGGELRDVARTIAAQLYGVDKDQLDGEDERESRRARRTLRGGIVALTLLTVVAVVAAVVAFVQLGEARMQSRISLSRQLAAVADNQLATNVDVANLLAVRAFRTDPNPQTRAALFRAVTSSGPLVRYLPFPASVSRLAGSADGTTVVVGLRDGQVFRWRLGDDRPARIAGLGSEVHTLSVSADGNTVVAADESTVHLSRPGREPDSIPIPENWKADAVAVSPSGRTVILTTSEKRFEGAMTVSVITVGGAALRRVDHDMTGQLSMSPSVVSTSDVEVFLLDAGYGSWDRRWLVDWRRLRASSASFGTANNGVTAAADGRSFSYTNGSVDIPVWRTDRPTDYFKPPSTAHAPIRSPQAITLNANGSRLAVAESGAIHVSPVRPAGAPPAETTRLSGTGRINTDGLRFLGTKGELLVSASADKVTLWNLAQPDRISRSSVVPLESACNACAPPRVALSSDGSLIVVTNDGSGGIAGPLDEPARIRELPDFDLSAEYGPAVWAPEAQRATVLMPSIGDDIRTPLLEALPDFLRPQVSGQRSIGVPAAGFTADARQIIVAQPDGEIDVLGSADGSIRTVVPGPGEPSESPTVAAAVSSTANLVAVADADDEEFGTLIDTAVAVTVRDALTGKPGRADRTTGRALPRVRPGTPSRPTDIRRAGDLGRAAHRRQPGDPG